MKQKHEIELKVISDYYDYSGLSSPMIELEFFEPKHIPQCKCFSKNKFTNRNHVVKSKPLEENPECKYAAR